jgi:CRP-like cAMP-binding protein
MIHKSTSTFLVDLKVGDNFGEIEFFTENPRMLSVKSRDYCEMYTINKKDFIRIAEDYIHAIVKSINFNFLVSLSYNKKLLN